MTVELKWITPDAEKEIMYCARVSAPKNQDSDDTRLLSYCLKHKHFSIFEMASMCVEINTSRTIARQILRHRSFSFQEFSQRYADVSALDTDIVISEARSQDTENRQNSNDDMSQEDKDWFVVAQEDVWEHAIEKYEEALDRGVAKEQARVFLPEGMTPTKMYMTGTIRSWIHYLTLRTGVETQREHREVAENIMKIFKEQLPTLAKTLDDLEKKT